VVYNKLTIIGGKACNNIPKAVKEALATILTKKIIAAILATMYVSIIKTAVILYILIVGLRQVISISSISIVVYGQVSSLHLYIDCCLTSC
jgi:hypothetical protein